MCSSRPKTQAANSRALAEPPRSQTAPTDHGSWRTLDLQKHRFGGVCDDQEVLQWGTHPVSMRHVQSCSQGKNKTLQEVRWTSSWVNTRHYAYEELHECEQGGMRSEISLGFEMGRCTYLNSVDILCWCNSTLPFFPVPMLSLPQASHFCNRENINAASLWFLWGLNEFGQV